MALARWSRSITHSYGKGSCIYTASNVLPRRLSIQVQSHRFIHPRRVLLDVNRNCLVVESHPNLSKEKSDIKYFIQNGKMTNTTEISLPWLRDHCPCPVCIDPSTRQKLRSSGHTPLRPKIESASIDTTTGALHVSWMEKRSSEGDAKGSLIPHQSVYSQDWLNQHILHSTPALKLTLPTVSWSGKDYSAIHHVMPFEELKSPSGSLQALKQLREYGLLFVDGVDHTGRLGMVEQVANVFGPLRETFYGRVWDVKSVPDAKNIAYTALDLDFHMDLMYFESPPGLQLLHALRNSTTGGESIFMDLNRAIDILRVNFPEHFDVLCRTNVRFEYKNDGHHLIYNRPIISLDEGNNRYNLFYSPPFQGVLSSLSSPEQADPFYAAFGVLDELIHLPEMSFTTGLEPGQVVLFANRRVLHGRKAFDPQSGERHFQGAYVDWDCLVDKMRVAGIL